MTHLEPGDAAPPFSVQDETGTAWSLDELDGSPFVLYFYPRDDTPGCTTEACQFDDAIDAFNQLKVPVLGVSDDDAESHQAFKDKHELSFPLLVDEDGALADAYGVWVKKNIFGNEVHGNERTTFLIDAGGTIAHVWTNVDPDGHAADVLETVQTL